MKRKRKSDIQEVIELLGTNRKPAKPKPDHIIVRCPNCGRLYAVPKRRATWWCRCKPHGRKVKYLVEETLLPDQTTLTLERGVSVLLDLYGPRLCRCKELKEVTIKGYEIIRSDAFRECTALRTVRLSNDVKVIGENAFRDCTSLEEIILPEGLVRIEKEAFLGSGLKRIAFPSGLWDIAPDAFDFCPLEDVEMSQEQLIDLPLSTLFNTPFLEKYIKQRTREDGVVEIHAVPCNRVFCWTAYEKPANRVSLTCYHAGWHAKGISGTFAESSEIMELHFAPGTRAIGPSMFRGCRNLRKLVLPDGLERIEECAFARCSALREVVIPKSVVEIEPFAFGKCGSLDKVEISESLLAKLDHSVFAQTPLGENIALLRKGCWRDALVVGIGGAGNAINVFFERIDCKHDVVVMDTHLDPLRFKSANVKILLGPNICHGCPSGGDPQVGAAATEAVKDRICALFQKYHLVVVVACLGGGTGSGGAPVLARWLREMKIPHLFVVMTPYEFESKRRWGQAQKALDALRQEGAEVIEVSGKQLQIHSDAIGKPLMFVNVYQAADMEIVCRLQSLLTQYEM